MDSVLYAGLTVIYAVLLLYGCVLLKRDSSWGLRYLLLIVTAGLVWDNGVLGIGKYIGEGDLLEGLNFTRFWVHALVTPLLVLVAFDLIRKAGSPWANKLAAAWGAWLLTAALIVLEVVTETLPLKLKPSMEYGVLRYVPAESGGPPLMVILVMIPLLMAGIIVWRRRKTPLLLIGTVLMAAGSAIPIPIESSAATNVFELLLLLSLWLTVRKMVSARTFSFR